MRRILVTGAGGFVGHHLLPALRAAFPDATLIATGLEARADIVRLDVCGANAVAAALEAARPDAIVHLAAVAAVTIARDDPDRAWRINLYGTLTLARAARRIVPNAVFLFVSSGDIYGASFAAARPLDESATPAPLNTYGATKAAADLAIGAMAAEGLRAIRVRPFNHTGPGQSESFVVAAFARQAARIKAGLQPAAMRVGRLDPWRDFLDVRDVVAAYVACLVRADAIAPGTILNIASGNARRIGDVLDDVLRMAGVTAAIEAAPLLERKADIVRAVGDASAAQALLGWVPRIAWPETVADVVADWTRRVAAGDD